MNYLFRYLSTLKPDEIERLKEIEATPRERDLLELLIAMRMNHEWTKQEAMKRLGMSGSMFDKTCSMLLREILIMMVPDGGMKLLEHLAAQGVYDLFLHELRRQEKEHLAAGKKEGLARFYAGAFDVLHFQFSSDYSERLARQFGAKYIRLNPSPDSPIHVEASLLRMAIWTEASRRRGDETRLRLEKRLRRNDERITETTGARARCSQLRAWIIYYGQLKRNPEQRMAALRAAAALCEEHPEIFSRREKVLTLCQIAEEHYYYRTDLLTPLRMYREIYELYPDVMAEEEYHTFKLIQLCMVNGEYDHAEKLLAQYFGEETNLVVPAGGRSKDVALIWTKLMLMTDRIADARRYLDTAVLLNQKGFYLQYEVECRMLHTAISFLEGDFDFVERRLPAHIKFLRSKGVTYKTARYYPWFFKLVGAFIDEQTIGKKLPPVLEKKMEEFMEGAAAQYGVLLRKLRGF